MSAFVTVLTLIWILAQAPLMPAPFERVVDRRTAPYYEDAVEPRPVAHVAVELLDRDGGLSLRVRVAACGALVDPVPGLEGVPGTNLRTAEELERLLRERALRLVTRDAGRAVAGRLAGVGWARLPAGRIDAHGFIDRSRGTAASWPAWVAFESARLPARESWSYLEVAGVPRLAVQVVGEQILAIESRGERLPAQRKVGR